MHEYEKTTHIAEALEIAQSKGYTKPYDIALAVKVELERRGIILRKAPRKKGKRT